MRKALVLGAALVALIAVFAANSLSQAAQSSTVNWDVRLSDTLLDSAGGDGDTLIEVGENPTAAVTLQLDLSGNAAPLEPFFDVATTQFDGQAPFAAADLAGVFGPAAVIPTGTTVGSGVFSIESSGPGAAPNTQCDSTGGNTVSPPAFTTRAGGGNTTVQPAAIPVLPGETWVGSYVQTFDDDNNDAPVVTPGIAMPNETAGLGDFPEDQEDTSPANGLPDGVDRMPYFIPTLLAGPFASLQPGYLGRGYAIAVIVPGVAQTSVHFLNFVIGDADGDGDEDYLTFTVLADPVTPSTPGPGQTTITCAPFSSTTTAHGVAAGPIPLRSMGTVSYTGAAAAPAGGVGTYRILKSSTDNFDGDDVPAPFDNCDAVPNNTQTDTDGDGAGDACDPNPGAANDDEDGDGWYNLTDNCPNQANPGQSDSDSDTVGDACDRNPLTEGNGLGYPTGGGIYEDDDDICDDPWTVGAAEPNGDPLGAPGSGNRFCLASVLPFNDSDDDLRPDFISITGTVDADSDRDLDGNMDCTESGGGGIGACPAGAAGDALDPTDGNFPGALIDEDADGHPSHQEVIDLARGVTAAVRSIPFCGAPSANPTKTGSDLDYDGNVTILDLSTGAGAFGATYSNTATAYNYGADLDKDGSNTILDLSSMAGFFGQPACP